MSYYTSIRHATPKNISRMYTPSREYQRTVQKASPKTFRRMIKEENTRVRYLSLHSVDKRAKEIANRTAANRNIHRVKSSLNGYIRELKTAREQNWSNHDMRLISYYPHPRSTLRKLIYYLKQHMKRLEFAKFLAGRKVAEMMMPKAKANYLKTLSGPMPRS
jgi:hypothetical protein